MNYKKNEIFYFTFLTIKKGINELFTTINFLVTKPIFTILEWFSYDTIKEFEYQKQQELEKQKQEELEKQKQERIKEPQALHLQNGEEQHCHFQQQRRDPYQWRWVS